MSIAIVIGPTPPGTGVIRAGDLARRRKVDVSTEGVAARIVGARLRVDAHVDHRGAGLEPRALDHLGGADSGDDNVGATHVPGQVRRARVAHRDRRVHRHEKVRDWHAHYVRAADDDDVLALDVDFAALQQLDAAGGRARHSKRRFAAAQAQIADVLAEKPSTSFTTAISSSTQRPRPMALAEAAGRGSRGPAGRR